MAFQEALDPAFARYAQAVVDNCQALAARLGKRGIDMVSGGSDTHLLLLDLRPQGLTGRALEASLERAGLTCNKNAVPFDPEKPTVTSGVRVGTPAATSRGFGTEEFTRVADMIADVIEGLAANGEDGNDGVQASVAQSVAGLCAKFPIYRDLRIA